ncbi:pitrilysin family protein [Temperatibacter marinus]|uniref:Pitrilysin family protein n=1 Tax=Temperatibacter marinus TaxID=1456591 RepID=A0AA52EHJ5_9PROT|nr:pitrilysin family protein [Temperatibacter marinus]WND02905.1 pitrilysin family protein [Temperatibacter marinus]
MTIEVTTLSNGLRVVSEYRRSVETASVGVWVNVGSRYEEPSLNGITHFLEHMLFKGTERRSARDIAYEIERVGGHMNAYTTRDYTTYYARVLKEDLPLAVDMLADIIQNSKLCDKEILREQDVVIQEIGQALDTPDDLVFDLMQEVAYPDQALGRTILGQPENVRSFNSTTLKGFMQSHYTAQNMVLAAAGKVDHAELVALAEKEFSSLPQGQDQGFEPAMYQGKSILDDKALEQSHVTLGFPAVGFHHDDYYALQVYSMALGGGMSSRLFQEVRENRGLAYSIYCFANCFSDHGLFGVYGGTSPDLVPEMVQVTLDQMKDMSMNMTSEELDVAKAQLKAGLLMAIEATTSRIEQIGRQILFFDRVIPIEEMISNVESVDLAKVKSYAADLIETGPVTSAIVGKVPVGYKLPL